MPAATTGTAFQRIPRSPSTVRVTGWVATTSRPRFASSGSSSITECTSVVAPPTSTTATSPCSAASTSTPRSTTSGVAARTRRAKSGSRDRFFPPITWARNISRIAARAPSGANTPISGTTLAAGTCGTSASASTEDTRPCASLLPASNDRSTPAVPCQHRGGLLDDRGVPAVGSAEEQHHIRPVGAQRRQRRRRQTSAHDGDDPATAGQRDPSAGLGRDQFLVADHRDPQTAARTGAAQHLRAGHRPVDG